MSYSPAEIPIIPTLATGRTAWGSGTPVRARELSVFAGINSYLGARFLRSHHCQVEFDDTRSLLATTSDQVDDAMPDVNVHQRFQIGPVSTLLWVGVQHFALDQTENKGTGSPITPRITVALYTTPGALIGARTVNRPRLERGEENARGLTRWSQSYTEQSGLNGVSGLAHIGWFGDDPFDVSAYQGQTLELRVLGEYCRIYAVDAVEVYTGAI